MQRKPPRELLPHLWMSWPIFLLGFFLPMGLGALLAWGLHALLFPSSPAALVWMLGLISIPAALAGVRLWHQLWFAYLKKFTPARIDAIEHYLPQFIRMDVQNATYQRIRAQYF